MVSRLFTTCVVVCGLALLVVACGHNSDVTTPDLTADSHSVGITQHYNWGMYDVAINSETGEVEVLPLRTAELNANVVRFLQPPIAPINLVIILINIGESDFPDGLVTMDIVLRHPFPGMTFFRGFDVRGIILADGEVSSQYDPNLVFHGPEGTRLLNPDGYTRWWNQVEFTTFETIFGYTEGVRAKHEYDSTSTLNPYKLFAEGLEPAQPAYQLDPDTRFTFPAIDGAFARKYRMQFDATQIPIFRFKYSIDASWAPPDPAGHPKYPVESFPPNANCREPYTVMVKEYEEIPYYVDEWVSGGDLIFLLTVGFHQATGGNVLDLIEHVWLESPTLFDTPVDVRDTMEFVESLHDTQGTFRISLEDMMPDAIDGQQLMICVATPYTYEPNIPGDTSGFVWPDGALSAHRVVNVPITNLTPEGDYAYVYFIPDWCATMRTQCANDADNQRLLANIMSQNIDGYYNDFTHVQVWEGKTNTSGQSTAALQTTCSSLGYTFGRTTNDYFDAAGSRVIIAVLFSMGAMPPNPPFTQEEAQDIQEFIENGGILFFMCEASMYFNDEGLEELFGWLGMLMEYGGGATPEMENGYTTNITWHWLTEDVELYHYYTCGQWITEDPHVLTLIATEIDEKLILMYPLPLE